MRKIFILLFFVLSDFAFAQSADSTRKIIVVDNICYVIEQDKAMVHPLKEKYKGDIEIPEMVSCDGKEIPVTGIASETFLRCDELQSISLPKTLETIGSWAFGFCTALRKVEFPESLKKVDNTAFYGCTGFPVANGLRYADKLLVETVDKSREEYVIQDGTRWIGANSMSNLPNAVKIILPLTVEVIGNFAFTENEHLATIMCGDKIAEIEYGAFSYCPNLEEFVLPTSLKSVGARVFVGSKKCEKHMTDLLKENGLYRELPN